MDNWPSWVMYRQGLQQNTAKERVNIRGMHAEGVAGFPLRTNTDPPSSAGLQNAVHPPHLLPDGELYEPVPQKKR